MEMIYEEYEEACQKIREENSELLKLFENDIKGLSSKTIKQHLDNVDFYINDYLLRDELCSIKEGITAIDSFLGDYFITHCMWSTPNSIKNNAASIKKFYKSMMEHGKIQKDDYKLLCSEIKSELPRWMEDCRKFNDPDEEDPFEVFLKAIFEE